MITIIIIIIVIFDLNILTRKLDVERLSLKISCQNNGRTENNSPPPPPKKQTQPQTKTLITQVVKRETTFKHKTFNFP